MINRGLGEYEIICDGCDEIVYSDGESWEEMSDFLKEEGWKIIRVAKEWEHYCPNCAEEADL